MATQNPIAALRQAKGMSRAAIARKMGISYMTLTAIDRGQVTRMNDGTVNKIAEFAKKNPDDIRKEFQEWREELKDAA